MEILNYDEVISVTNTFSEPYSAQKRAWLSPKILGNVYSLLLGANTSKY
jgi:hypothetical protein